MPKDFPPIELKPLGGAKPLKIYSLWGSPESSISYYRITDPFRTMFEKGMAAFIFDSGHEKVTIGASNRERVMNAADIHYYHLILGKPILDCLINAGQRPSFFFGLDDLVEYVSPWNPSFLHLGTRLPDGTALEPGDDVMIGGRVMWRHGKSYGNVTFDVQDNIDRMNMLKAIVHECDGVVVTTPELKAEVLKYGNPNVYIYPNSIMFNKYRKIELMPHPEEVRILWQGGNSHYEDMYDLKDSIVKVLAKYKHAKFLMWGHNVKWVSDALPDDQLEIIRWVQPPAFTVTLSTIGHDINLCPLKDTLFNRCKSAIKWYESSAIWQPAATLARGISPYTEIQDGETGLLYNTPEEFEEKLGALIEDATLRKRLAHNAKDWVNTNRNIENTILPYYDWLKTTHESTRKDREAFINAT